MHAILMTILIMTAFTGLLALLLSLAKATIGNYGEVNLTINDDKIYSIQGGDSLLSTLIEQKIFIPSACGGKGSCGYCKVKIIEGGGPVLPTELSYLTKEDIKDNIRLSCQCKIKAPMTIEIPEELFNVKEYEGRLESLIDLTPTIKHLKIKLPQGEALNFKPGQYIQLKAPKYKGNKEEIYRAYSIASSHHHKKTLELIIGYVPKGICTTYVHQFLKEKDTVIFNGPYGDFHYRDGDREIIMVAVGTGMAPIRSILHHMKVLNSKRKVTFFFGARHSSDLFFLDEMKSLAEDLQDFTFIPSLSRPKPEAYWAGEVGRVTDTLEKYIKDGDNKEAYLCGSPAMIDSVVALLKKKGLPEERIYYDKFE